VKVETHISAQLDWGTDRKSRQIQNTLQSIGRLVVEAHLLLYQSMKRGDCLSRSPSSEDIQRLSWIQIGGYESLDEESS
jgi:hypothetical protein